MTSQNETGATPEIVALHATQPNVLEHFALALLGIFGPSDDLRALVLLPGGRMQRVAIGKRLAGGRVVGIDGDGIMVLKNGATRRIAVPGV